MGATGKLATLSAFLPLVQNLPVGRLWQTTGLCLRYV